MKHVIGKLMIVDKLYICCPKGRLVFINQYLVIDEKGINLCVLCVSVVMIIGRLCGLAVNY